MDIVTEPSPSSPSNRGVFTPGSNFGDRYIPDYQRLVEVTRACRAIGLRLVLTMGTFDIIHIGHFQYLERCREFGDVLVVGVDSDAKVKARKGPTRPIVPEEERVQMLAHVRHVDIVTLKDVASPKWELIKLIRPDTLVATKATYSQDDLEVLKNYCGQVVVLDPQATTSTTAKLRRIHLGLAHRMKAVVEEAVETAFDRLSNEEQV